MKAFNPGTNVSALCTKIKARRARVGVMSGLRQTLSDPRCRAVIAEIHPTLLPPGVTDDEILKLLSSCGFAKIDTLRWRGIPEFYAIAVREAV